MILTKTALMVIVFNSFSRISENNSVNPFKEKVSFPYTISTNEKIKIIKNGTTQKMSSRNSVLCDMSFFDNIDTIMNFLI